MEYVKRCIKFQLPNGHVVDILEPVIREIENWLQVKNTLPESCGFLMGYLNPRSGNVTISNLTTPQIGDVRTRIFCQLRDRIHFKLLSMNQKHQNYYMGVWHTHPQKIPSPSSIDWSDWNDTLHKDRTGSAYAFFIIAGTEAFRIWIGDFATGEITEIFETEIIEGVYTKENEAYEN